MFHHADPLLQGLYEAEHKNRQLLGELKEAKLDLQDEQEGHRQLVQQLKGELAQQCGVGELPKEKLAHETNIELQAHGLVLLDGVQSTEQLVQQLKGELAQERALCEVLKEKLAHTELMVQTIQATDNLELEDQLQQVKVQFDEATHLQSAEQLEQTPQRRQLQAELETLSEIVQTDNLLEDERAFQAGISARLDNCETQLKQVMAAKSRVETENNDLRAELENKSALLQASDDALTTETAKSMQLSQQVSQLEHEALALPLYESTFQSIRSGEISLMTLHRLALMHTKD